MSGIPEFLEFSPPAMAASDYLAGPCYYLPPTPKAPLAATVAEAPAPVDLAGPCYYFPPADKQVPATLSAPLDPADYLAGPCFYFPPPPKAEAAAASVAEIGSAKAVEVNGEFISPAKPLQLQDSSPATDDFVSPPKPPALVEDTPFGVGDGISPPKPIQLQDTDFIAAVLPGSPLPPGGLGAVGDLLLDLGVQENTLTVILLPPGT